MLGTENKKKTDNCGIGLENLSFKEQRNPYIMNFRHNIFSDENTDKTLRSYYIIPIDIETGKMFSTPDVSGYSQINNHRNRETNLKKFFKKATFLTRLSCTYKTGNFDSFGLRIHPQTSYAMDNIIDYDSWYSNKKFRELHTFSLYADTHLSSMIKRYNPKGTNKLSNLISQSNNLPKIGDVGNMLMCNYIAYEPTKELIDFSSNMRKYKYAIIPVQKYIDWVADGGKKKDDFNQPKNTISYLKKDYSAITYIPKKDNVEFKKNCDDAFKAEWFEQWIFYNAMIVDYNFLCDYEPEEIDYNHIYNDVVDITYFKVDQTALKYWLSEEGLTRIYKIYHNRFDDAYIDEDGKTKCFIVNELKKIQDDMNPDGTYTVRYYRSYTSGGRLFPIGCANMYAFPREIRDSLLSEYAQCDMDNACPTELINIADKMGYTKNLTEIRSMLDDKGAYRSYFTERYNIDKKSVKKLLHSIMMGATKSVTNTRELAVFQAYKKVFEELNIEKKEIGMKEIIFSDHKVDTCVDGFKNRVCGYSYNLNGKEDLINSKFGKKGIQLSYGILLRNPLEESCDGLFYNMVHSYILYKRNTIIQKAIYENCALEVYGFLTDEKMIALYSEVKNLQKFIIDKSFEADHNNENTPLKDRSPLWSEKRIGSPFIADARMIESHNKGMLVYDKELKVKVPYTGMLSQIPVPSIYMNDYMKKQRVSVIDRKNVYADMVSSYVGPGLPVTVYHNTNNCELRIPKFKLSYEVFKNPNGGVSVFDDNGKCHPIIKRNRTNRAKIISFTTLGIESMILETIKDLELPDGRKLKDLGDKGIGLYIHDAVYINKALLEEYGEDFIASLERYIFEKTGYRITYTIK